MKKRLVFAFAFIFSVMLFCGCGNKGEKDTYATKSDFQSSTSSVCDSESSLSSGDINSTSKTEEFKDLISGYVEEIETSSKTNNSQSSNQESARSESSASSEASSASEGESFFDFRY